MMDRRSLVAIVDRRRSWSCHRVSAVGTVSVSFRLNLKNRRSLSEGSSILEREKPLMAFRWHSFWFENTSDSTTFIFLKCFDLKLTEHR